MSLRYAHPQSRSASARHGFLRTTVLPLLLGLTLRLWFIHHNPDLSGDPLLYGAIARNLIQHGVYGFSATAPTLIRLPGYPLFLAACFFITGGEHYYPVLFLQGAVDLLGCLILERLAGRLASAAGHPEQASHAAAATLWLAALCPFTACYTAAPLTETLELFSITVALYALARTLSLGEREPRPQIKPRWFAPAVAACIIAALLRPDGALLGATLLPALILYGFRRGFPRWAVSHAALGGLACLLAFAPWAARNWRTFHVFEPLAPRYATDPGEPTNPGFQRWTKTVCADLACTAEVYWAADDQPIGIDELPSRAFDSPQQLRETAELLAAYNRNTTLTPALDARFAALARERFIAHPVRSYLGMPLLRLTDMWFRPRVELFNIDLRWWNYGAEGPDTVLAWALAALNVLYLALAVAGALARPPMLGIFVAFTVLRCALLWTIEAPEPRYTLECFPMIFLLGGLALSHFRQRATV